MGKITFRADEDLVAELEAFDASKSEVMREALREYLDRHESDSTASGSDGGDRAGTSDSLDALLEDRIDSVLDDRLGGHSRPATYSAPDVNVTIALEGVDGTAVAGIEAESNPTASPSPEIDRTDGQHVDRTTEPVRKTPTGGGGTATDTFGSASANTHTCEQCGSDVAGDHVYCPNCGEKASHRVFCDCGDEVRSDWAFCPSCGRRTPAADVLDSSGS